MTNPIETATTPELLAAASVAMNKFIATDEGAWYPRRIKTLFAATMTDQGGEDVEDIYDDLEAILGDAESRAERDWANMRYWFAWTLGRALVGVLHADGGLCRKMVAGPGATSVLIATQGKLD